MLVSRSVCASWGYVLRDSQIKEESILAQRHPCWPGNNHNLISHPRSESGGSPDWRRHRRVSGQPGVLGWRAFWSAIGAVYAHTVDGGGYPGRLNYRVDGVPFLGGDAGAATVILHLVLIAHTAVLGVFGGVMGGTLAKLRGSKCG
jgi:hypothetical protein